MNKFPYEAGDIVHFKKASLSSNRTRDYLVTEVFPAGIAVKARGFSYEFTHETAKSLDVTVVTKKGE